MQTLGIKGAFTSEKGITVTERQINKQTEYAVEKADIALLLIDGKVGVTAEDRGIAA